MKARLLAYYLPQFHPIPENDDWWGKGFTEWTNVARARKLFPGHYQPHIPADLGFYDLRLPEVREQQASLARQAGIEGFCYYEYWFGSGRRLLNRPFDEVVASGKPDFPFCLAWANHSWYKKRWDPKAKGCDELLIEQRYLGEDDYIAHFNSLLSAFKDKRYVRVNGKLFYIVYDALHFDDVAAFINVWRRLAREHGLGDFFFVATDFNSEHYAELKAKGFDATHNVDHLNIYHTSSILNKVWLTFTRKCLNLPMIYRYKNAIKYMLNESCRQRDVIPVVAPNWDHTPRSGAKGMVMTGAEPKFFKRLVQRALEMVKDKPAEERIIIVKSWNEWAEGNYMEPDLKYGHGYIEALAEALEGK